MTGIWDDIKKSVGGFASKAAEKAVNYLEKPPRKPRK
jgi:hypothetical protein